MTSLLQKFAIILLAIGFFGITGFPDYAQAQNAPLLTPSVYISSPALAQADTLVVVVKNEPQKITGTLGLVPLRFFRNQDGADWVSLVGIPITKKPGGYTLSVQVPGRAPFVTTISVAKREFPITTLVITPQLIKRGFRAKKIIKTINNTENVQLHAVLKIVNPKTYITKPFVYPLSTINVVGPFGDIRAAKNYKIQHLGVDLKADMNTPVVAVNDGKVVFAKALPDYGNTLIIDHGLGAYSLYLHLSEFNVKKGAKVKQQDVIGLSGESGYVTGPHLHFAIKVRGAALDPLKFIQTTQTTW